MISVTGQIIEKNINIERPKNIENQNIERHWGCTSQVIIPDYPQAAEV
jgi:hypothetical protein